MQRAMYKYPLQPGNYEQCVIMPHGAEIVAVQMQDNLITMWALIDPAQREKVQRRFRVVPTGTPFDVDGTTYRATIQLASGSTVLHVFEVAP